MPHRSVLYTADGRFEHNYLNNFQHSLMYGTIGLAGIVDIVGTVTHLPHGTETVCCEC